MELDNASPFDAIVQVADLAQEELRAAVIIKSTFNLGPEGQLLPCDDSMPLVRDYLDCPFGVFHGELFFKKVGVDVCVLGTVRRSEPVPHARMRLNVGEHRHELLVSGDRAWIPSSTRKGLEPSRPVPFTEMPLSYHRTYGGTAEYNGEQAPYPENPHGVGYYLEEDEARGKRLPNVEPLSGPFVQRWSDRGVVAGWGPYPMFWALRAQKNVTVDEEKLVVQDVSPGLFNHGHPALVFASVETGTPVLIDGLHPHRISLLAPAPPARVEARIGRETRDVPAPVDGIFVWADAGKVVITQRARFGYVYHPEEIRRVTVHGV
jgi:hypothetical protein